MALLGIDELNLIDTYFDEMELSEEDKKNRVDLCEDLFYIYYYIFALISTDFRLRKPIDIKEYTDKLAERFKDVLDATEYAKVVIDEEIANYIDEISKNLVESTLRNLPVEDEEDNLDDIVRPASPYWSSTERAIRVAEDMTNVIANYKELQDKIAEGYTHKTWVSILDTHTRESHWLAWGKTVPINKPFTIGSSLMMCPCEYTAPAREIVNCRCKLLFYKDNDKQLILPKFVKGGYTNHLAERLEERGITTQEVSDTLEHPLHITETKYNKDNEPAQLYIGNGLIVCYNPLKASIPTVWKANEKTIERYKKK